MINLDGVMKQFTMHKILKNLNVDETYTRLKNGKEKVFNKVKNNISHTPDCNMMADILYLPTTKKGFKYLLVVVDLYTDEFDCEPLKNKDSEYVLNAMLKMFKGKYLKQPVALQTDSGTEFKGVFHKYLYDHNVLHTQTLPGRHTQMANVESLNRTLGRLLNGYMNGIEMKTHKQYNEWTDVLDSVVKELNEYRRMKRGSILPEDNPYLTSDEYVVPIKPPKFTRGDLVHYQLDEPENALGHKQNTKQFREGDFRYSPVAKKIVSVIVMNDEPRYRYMLQGINNASYTEHQLFKSKDNVERFRVKAIIGSRFKGNKKEYLVWWKGYKKSEATYERRKDLIDDGLQDLIDLYESSF